jgi:hypothetical protein
VSNRGSSWRVASQSLRPLTCFGEGSEWRIASPALTHPGIGRLMSRGLEVRGGYRAQQEAPPPACKG